MFRRFDEFFGPVVESTDMAQRGFELSDDPAASAIERVLEAERASEEQLRDCRRRAEDIVVAARGRAEAIAARRDARIAKLRESFLQRTERDIDALAHATRPTTDVDESPGEHALARAAARLAAKLTDFDDERPR
jgi:vacuolar-type H+-ATPase subunit H